MERSSNCDAIHNCSPTLNRLALLGTFPGGEGFPLPQRRYLNSFHPRKFPTETFP